SQEVVMRAPSVAAMVAALLMLLPSHAAPIIPAVGTVVRAHDSQAKPSQTQSPKKSAEAKLAEPLPDAATLAARRRAARTRRLFQNAEPIAVILAADFKA